jgi:hypothetical protein
LHDPPTRSARPAGRRRDSGTPHRLAEVYRVPFLNAALFFAFFMLTDPPTSAGRHDEQLRFGTIAGASAIALFVAVHDLSFLLLALLAANLWLAGRRIQRERSVHARLAARRPRALARQEAR